MEKLVELLNEYIKEKKLGNTVKEIDDDFFVNNYNNWDGYLCETVMSKNFGFIERLVKNDKIDRSKVLITFSMAEYDGLGNMYGHGVDDNQRLLMILAISDTPIEDLISYLRE